MSIQQTTRQIPISLATIAWLMEMEKEEVQFFPHFSEIRQILSDYTLDCSTVEWTVKKLQSVKSKCIEGMEVYQKAIDSLCSKLALGVV